MTITAKFVTGSTLKHVITMTLSASIGLVAVFAVDALNLFYISKLGQSELAAAVGYAGTLLFFHTSIAIGLSIAATALVSRALGSGKRDYAKQLSGAALISMAAIMVFLTILTFPFLRPLVEALGATGKTADLAVRFMRFVLPSIPVMGLGMCMSALLRAVGDAKQSMYVTLSAALCTAALDPLLIFVFDLGLDGAAIATSISRLLMLTVGFTALNSKHGLLAMPKTGIYKTEMNAYLLIAVPAVLTQIATPVGNTIVTRFMAGYGDSAVVAWSIIGRLIPVAFGVIFALSGAIGPIVGQNLGAQRFDRIRTTIQDSLKVTVVYVLAVWLLLALTRHQIAGFFSATGQAQDLISFFCLAVAGSFLFNGTLFVANAAFNNLGFALYSTLLNWGRATLGVIPFVWVGAHYFGAVGVLAGYGLGVVLFGVIGGVLCFKVLARLERESAQKKQVASI
jgi:putative MATE family efflux protein